MKKRAKSNRSRVTSYSTGAKLSPSIRVGHHEKAAEKETLGSAAVFVAHLTSVWESPEAFELLHPGSKLRFSIRSFPWGIAARSGLGCGGVETELTSPGFQASTTDDPGQSSCNLGTTNDRDSVATAQRQSQAASFARVSFSPTRSARGGGSPFSAHKSLYAPVAPTRLYSSPTNN